MDQLESKSYPCKFIRSADPTGKIAYPLRIDPTKDFPQPLSTIEPLSFSVHHPHSTPPTPAVAAGLSMETSIATVPRGSQRPPEAPQEPNPSPDIYGTYTYIWKVARCSDHCLCPLGGLSWTWLSEKDIVIKGMVQGLHPIPVVLQVLPVKRSRWRIFHDF